MWQMAFLIQIFISLSSSMVFAADIPAYVDTCVFEKDESASCSGGFFKTCSGYTSYKLYCGGEQVDISGLDYFYEGYRYLETMSRDGFQLDSCSSQREIDAESGFPLEDRVCYFYRKPEPIKPRNKLPKQNVPKNLNG